MICNTILLVKLRNQLKWLEKIKKEKEKKWGREAGNPSKKGISRRHINNTERIEKRSRRQSKEVFGSEVRKRNKKWREYRNGATAFAGNLIKQGPIDASHVVGEGRRLESQNERSIDGGGVIVRKGFGSHGSFALLSLSHTHFPLSLTTVIL